MPEFIFAYHGGKSPASPEEGAQAMAQWQNWFKGLGKAVVNPGNPVGMSRTVNAKGVRNDGGANPLSGFSVVRADDIEGAVRMAKGCPMVTDGSGSVEVAPILQM